MLTPHVTELGPRNSLGPHPSRAEAASEVGDYERQPEHGRIRPWIVMVLCLLGALLSPRVASASPGVATVSFSGLPSSPEIHITGEGFGTLPVASNLAYQGYTGYDYGEALYLCDTSNDPGAFCAGENNGGGGDTIGLVINTYFGTEIAYALGSTYSSSYYPSNTFRLQQGDNVTVHIAGLGCSGLVDYSGTPLSCNLSSAGGPNVPPGDGPNVPPIEDPPPTSGMGETGTPWPPTTSSKQACPGGDVVSAKGAPGKSAAAGHKPHKAARGRRCQARPRALCSRVQLRRHMRGARRIALRCPGRSPSRRG